MTDDLPPCKCGASVLIRAHGKGDAKRYTARCTNAQCRLDVDCHHWKNWWDAAEEWRKMQEGKDD